MVFYRRHLCRLDPWPDEVVEAFAWIERGPDRLPHDERPERVPRHRLDPGLGSRRTGSARSTCRRCSSRGRHDEATPALQDDAAATGSAARSGSASKTPPTPHMSRSVSGTWRSSGTGSRSTTDYPRRGVSLHPPSRLPAPWRRIVDWVVTLAVAIGFVLAFEAEVAKPFRIPSASMENTLHCARPARDCRSSTSDRVLVNRLAYVFGSPHRGQSSSSGSGPDERLRGRGRRNDVRQAADRTTGRDGARGRPRLHLDPRAGGDHADEARRAVPLPGCPTRRLGLLRADLEGAGGRVLHGRRQPARLVRLAILGRGSQKQPDRPRDLHVLAAGPDLVPPGRLVEAGLRGARSRRRWPGRSRCTSSPMP